MCPKKKKKKKVGITILVLLHEYFSLPSLSGRYEESNVKSGGESAG